MSKLYEIDNAILECFDLETGEILDSERLNALQIEREEKIEKVALWYKNLLSDAEQYKAEKEVFDEREKKAKKKAESLKKWLEYALGGQAFSTSKVLIGFRKSEQVEVNEEEFIHFAQCNDRDDLLSYKEPTPNKTAIKKAIKDGQHISGCTLVEKQNINIK